MWLLYERASVKKDLRKCPEAIREKYETWKVLVVAGGSKALRPLPGYHDEALKGKLTGVRSSRLGSQYRVIYAAHPAASMLEVIAITPHAYEKIKP